MLEWRLLQRTLFSTTSEMQTKSLAVHPTTLISAEKKEEDMPSSGEEDTESGAAESLPAGAGERTVVEEPAAQDKAFVKAKEPETEPILHPGPNDVLMGRGGKRGIAPVPAVHISIIYHSLSSDLVIFRSTLHRLSWKPVLSRTRQAEKRRVCEREKTKGKANCGG